MFEWSALYIAASLMWENERVNVRLYTHTVVSNMYWKLRIIEPILGLPQSIIPWVSDWYISLSIDIMREENEWRNGRVNKFQSSEHISWILSLGMNYYEKSTIEDCWLFSNSLNGLQTIPEGIYSHSFPLIRCLNGKNTAWRYERSWVFSSWWKQNSVSRQCELSHSMKWNSSRGPNLI